MSGPPGSLAVSVPAKTPGGGSTRHRASVTARVTRRAARRTERTAWHRPLSRQVRSGSSDASCPNVSRMMNLAGDVPRGSSEAGCGDMPLGDGAEVKTPTARPRNWERAADVGTESRRLGRCCRANRPMSRSELSDHPSDAESPAHLVILVGEGANDDFQIDVLAQREVGSTWGGEILHQVRTILGSHVVRHQLQILLQRPLRSPGYPPPESQPSARGRLPDSSGPLGLRVLSWERLL
jgi:hypothetical protein